MRKQKIDIKPERGLTYRLPGFGTVTSTGQTIEMNGKVYFEFVQPLTPEWVRHHYIPVKKFETNTNGRLSNEELESKMVYVKPTREESEQTDFSRVTKS